MRRFTIGLHAELLVERLTGSRLKLDPSSIGIGRRKCRRTLFGQNDRSAIAPLQKFSRALKDLSFEPRAARIHSLLGPLFFIVVVQRQPRGREDEVPTSHEILDGFLVEVLGSQHVEEALLTIAGTRYEPGQVMEGPRIAIPADPRDPPTAA